MVLARTGLGYWPPNVSRDGCICVCFGLLAWKPCFDSLIQPLAYYVQGRSDARGGNALLYIIGHVDRGFS
jgi:hypothetical protein